MGSMAAEEKKQSWTVLIAIGVALLLFPVFYVLGTGPGLWLENHGYLPVGVLGIVYYPITFACDSSPVINGAFARYWSLWT
jgi:hypothetical protein